MAKERNMANTTSIPEAAVLESAIEHAKETTDVATKNLREMAQQGARKASEGYEQFSKATQEANEQLTTQFAEAREGVAQTGLKLLDVAKEDTDATFAAMRELLAAKSLVEVFDVSAKYWRGRIEARAAHMHDLGVHVRKVTDDAVRPVRERMEKLTQLRA
jgi:hypothetical protein